jgi:hypothetical protein
MNSLALETPQKPIFPAFLGKILRTAIRSIAFTTMLFGIFFLLECLSGGLRGLSLWVMFHPLSAPFFAAMYLFVSLFFFVFSFALNFPEEVFDAIEVQMIRWIPDDNQRERLTLVASVVIILSAAGLFLYWNPSNPVARFAPPEYTAPSDKVLLHFAGTAQPFGKNIEGKARIRSLGDGRYMVQLLPQEKRGLHP